MKEKSTEKDALKDESGSRTVGINSLPIESLELIPLCTNHNSLGILTSLNGRLGESDMRLDGFSRDISIVGQVEPHLSFGDFRVVDCDASLLGQEVIGD